MNTASVSQPTAALPQTRAQFGRDVPTIRRQFASDNYAGICPEAWQAMEEANQGHERSYGDDRWTQQASDLIREVFETHCDVFSFSTAPAANSLALASLCQSYHSIMCHELAHVETDECGAPEFFSNGRRCSCCPGENGKVTPAGIERMVKKRTDIHFPKPRVISVTQATEVGTVYTPDDLKAIGAVAHGLGLRVHMDGARFANAVASLRLRAEGDHVADGRRCSLLRRNEKWNGRRRRGRVLQKRNSRTNSSIAASKRASSRRRCGSFPRRGPEC
jgi:hypothetical protein